MRFRRARAPRRAGDTRSTHYGRALHEREAAVPSAPARAPTCQPCPSLREVACACSALARLCARSLWGRGPARALPTRARAAPRWRHSLHALWKGTARARSRRSFGARPVLPRASPAPHFARWLARVARLRASALALSGDEAQHVRFRRARAPRRAGDTRSTHHGRALHEREAAVPSAPARAPTCQPCPSLREVACACSALARHCARSLWGRGPARALPTRARAAPRWRHSLHAPWKGTARARSRRSFGARPVLPRASPAPHFARWLARVARLRATALALSGDEAQHVRFRRAPRRAALATLGPRTMEGHCTSEKPPFLRRQPVLPRASPAPHFARWLARVARLRASALALSGDEAQHVRFRRARAPRRAGDTRSMHRGRALHEREAAVPSAPARAPTCQPCPSLREVACACSALACHCARSLWGRGPARALPTRARAAPRWRHSLHAPWKGTARARSRRSFGASPCSHVPALPLTARGGLRV